MLTELKSIEHKLHSSHKKLHSERISQESSHPNSSNHSDHSSLELSSHSNLFDESSDVTTLFVRDADSYSEDQDTQKNTSDESLHENVSSTKTLLNLQPISFPEEDLSLPPPLPSSKIPSPPISSAHPLPSSQIPSPPISSAHLLS